MTGPRKGGQFAPGGGRIEPSRPDPSQTSRDDVVAAADETSEYWGRFVASEATKTIEAVHRMFGVNESGDQGPAWAWWSMHGYETIEPGTEVHTAQGGLRGDHHVDDYRAMLRAGGPQAVFPEPPEPDEDNDPWDINPNDWPHLVRDQNQLWVIDGQHRLAAATAENMPATVIVADLDAHREWLTTQPAQPRPDTDAQMVGHVTEGHLFENDWLDEDVDVLDPSDPEADNADGFATVTRLDMDRWHDEMHRLGVSDHRH